MKTFDHAAVTTELAGTRFATHLRHLPSVGSTNSLAIEAAQAGVREGVWVADEQTAGRGRGGHGWHSAMGEGLYVSVLVVPQIPASQALWISLATAIAVRLGINEASGLLPDVRWPNDLMLNGRKCGGILVESSIAATQATGAERMRYAVIGIGINVDHASFPEELRSLATSLRLEASHRVNRETLLTGVLRNLDRELSLLDGELSRGSTRQSLLDRFAAASSWVRGKRVRVGDIDGYTGVTAGLTSNGFLRVDAEDGTQRVVLSGGVREVKS